METTGEEKPLEKRKPVMLPSPTFHYRRSLSTPRTSVAKRTIVYNDSSAPGGSDLNTAPIRPRNSKVIFSVPLLPRPRHPSNDGAVREMIYAPQAE